MNEYRRELVEIQDELSEIEVQIEDLLHRQASLQTRKNELETILKQNSTKSKDEDVKWDKTDFEWSEDLEDKMKAVFRINKLRPLQLQTMNVTLSGKDCILIMPTGGGKSLCFQLPALLSPGITLVVSPLVSLMEDQTMALENLGVEATLLNASSTKDTVNYVHSAMIDKNTTLKLLYVTPEKLAKSKRFMAKLEKMYKAGLFSRLVIDEVHCCSQWGHDFRPDYKFLGIMKRQFPGVPILGLTATATIKVIEDVKNILNLHGCCLFKASFNRPNLYYEVREKPPSKKETMDEMHKLIQKKFSGKSGIVYCFSRKDAEDVAAELRQRGIKTGVYHADCSARERSRVHRAWLGGQILVVVATVAFGMGIDKPDVRFVIHHSLSKSMENLYQESGRAGRDDKVSHCILYYRFADVFRQSTMVFTEQTGLDNLYGIMEYCTDMKKCRRSIIARHFGEVWDKSQCNAMCDHCDTTPAPKERRDVTKVCLNVLQIIDQADNDDSRVTAQKLIDSLQGRGPQALRVQGMENVVMARDKLERILAQMLILGVVQEYFHFTPYNTISYIVKGPKAKLLRSGKVKVDMDFPVKGSTSLNASKEETSVCTNGEISMSSSKCTSSATPTKLTTSKSAPSSAITAKSSHSGATSTKSAPSSATITKSSHSGATSTKSAPSGATPTKLSTSSSVNKNCKDLTSDVKSGDKMLKKSVSSPSTSTNSKHSINIPSESQKKRKLDNSAPELVIINTTLSHFTNHIGTKSDSANAGSKMKSDNKKSCVKKRKPIIFDSDSDELDFDQEVKRTHSKPPIKKSKCKEKSKNIKQNVENSVVNDADDVVYGNLELDASIFDEDLESETENSSTALTRNQNPIMIDSESDNDSDVVLT